MADQNVGKNEAMLGMFLDRADKKFVTQVGVMALALLTEKFPPDMYAQFLEECVNNAQQLMGHALLNTNQPKVSTPGGGPAGGSTASAE